MYFIGMWIGNEFEEYAHNHMSLYTIEVKLSQTKLWEQKNFLFFNREEYEQICDS